MLQLDDVYCVAAKSLLCYYDNSIRIVLLEWNTIYTTEVVTAA